MECTRCGRCCAQDPAKTPWYDVELFIMDELRIPLDLQESRRGGPDRTIANWMKRNLDGSCVAFRDGACLIHDKKPQECREYQIGGAKCLELRQQATRPNS